GKESGEIIFRNYSVSLRREGVPCKLHRKSVFASPRTTSSGMPAANDGLAGTILSTGLVPEGRSCHETFRGVANACCSDAVDRSDQSGNAVRRQTERRQRNSRQ